eukprot:gene2614-3239_t
MNEQLNIKDLQNFKTNQLFNSNNIKTVISTIGNEEELRSKIYYLGSLITPYYVNQLNRNHFEYYLVLVKDNNEINQQQSLDNNNFKSEWIKPSELIKDWKESRKLISPETLYILSTLNYFEKDQLSTLLLEKQPIEPESEHLLGTKVKLEYAPDIESIPVLSNTLLPFSTTNLIVVKSNGNALLIDPGANVQGSEHMKNIIESHLVGYLGNEKGQDCLSIFITHNHKDHWEGLPLIEHYFPSATLFAHPNTLDQIPTNLKKVGLLGKILESNILQQQQQQQQNDNVLKIGDFKFDVIFTPGHTNDSLCLFNRESRTLIAGDHIVGWGSSILDFETGNMKQYFNSTQGMIDYLKPRIAIPAHGPTNYDPILLLKNYIQHRLTRENAILEAYQSGNTSLQQILNIVYKGIDPRLNMMAMGNIKLHLDKLKDDNKI